MKKLKPTKLLGLVTLLLIIVSSCKKINVDIPGSDATSSNLSGTMDGQTLSVSSTGLSATYYSSAGDPANALLTNVTVDNNGSGIDFFIPDISAGTTTITPKLGTTANPGNPGLKIETTSTSAINVQAYVAYKTGGNTYYAISGTITTTTDGNKITVKWNLTFKDATGRTFTSTGSFVIYNYTTVTKPKTTITDPTPVAAAPTINSIAPAAGYYGDSIIVAGTNFSTTLTDNVVKINGIAAYVKSATATRIVILAPSTGSTGAVTVKVKNSETATGPTFTYIPTPTITGITPTSGKVGVEMNITGTNFSTVLTDDIVLINGVPAPVRIATETRLTLTVPANASSGVVTLKVKGKDAISNMPGSAFTFQVMP